MQRPNIVFVSPTQNPSCVMVPQQLQPVEQPVQTYVLIQDSAQQSGYTQQQPMWLLVRRFRVKSTTAANDLLKETDIYFNLNR
ncbi:hypothetical protein LSH36_845g00006 [Paralvinella palmiformis]|uniref:Uncharacterized protein n=1 Tax=Paralvinella palmiformis TaxID=53620 RepID=A0AAD9IZT8_9ANNE|nr:hypothetical protein LSH36_845g00006 [Paralvinella palmiformis]